MQSFCRRIINAVGLMVLILSMAVLNHLLGVNYNGPSWRKGWVMDAGIYFLECHSSKDWRYREAMSVGQMAC